MCCPVHSCFIALSTKTNINYSFILQSLWNRLRILILFWRPSSVSSTVGMYSWLAWEIGPFQSWHPKFGMSLGEVYVSLLLSSFRQTGRTVILAGLFRILFLEDSYAEAPRRVKAIVWVLKVMDYSFSGIWLKNNNLSNCIYLSFPTDHTGELHRNIFGAILGMTFIA